jgi:hypothetical protein
MYVIKEVAMYLSLTMSIFLFYYGFWEGIRIFNEDGKVKGETFLLSIVMGFVFAILSTRLS